MKAGFNMIINSKQNRVKITHHGTEVDRHMYNLELHQYKSLQICTEEVHTRQYSHIVNCQ